MNYDDATIPAQASPDHPTWPTSPTSRPPRQPRLARPNGCALALGIVGAFVAGVILTALVFTFTAPKAPLSTSTSQTGGALRVTITDTFLNDALNASGGDGLSQIQSHIQSNGRLTISGVLQGTPIGSGETAVVVLAPAVSQGKLIVNPVSGSIGGFPLPGLALDSVASTVNQQLSQANSLSIGGGLNLSVKSITFTDGAMTISYA